MARLYHTNMSLNDIAWTFEVKEADVRAMIVLFAHTEPLWRERVNKVADNTLMAAPCIPYAALSSRPAIVINACFRTALPEGPLVRGTYDDTERARIRGTSEALSYGRIEDLGCPHPKESLTLPVLSPARGL